MRSITPFAQRCTQLLTLGALFSLEPIASAHISITRGGTHTAREGSDGLKDSPCGVKGSSRGTSVHTYKPGATINISLVETISHPGYFRIAFDQDGDDDFEIPSGTDGAFGDCAGDPACGPGLEDYCNNEAVLLDNLNPHASKFLSTETYTWSVTLPNIECDNCTLQIIQVMNDLNVHRAAYPADDIYYNCIDLVLDEDAPAVDETPVPNEGIVCQVPTDSTEVEPDDSIPMTGNDAMGEAGPKASTAADDSANPDNDADIGSAASQDDAASSSGDATSSPPTSSANALPAVASEPPPQATGVEPSPANLPTPSTEGVPQEAIASAPAATMDGASGCRAARSDSGSPGAGLAALILGALLLRRRETTLPSS